MTSYQMACPPPVAGLYMLRNTVTGMLYVGKAINLKVRHQEWRAVFRSGLGHKSQKLRAAMTDPAEWEFVVVKETPGVIGKDLLALEAKLIDACFRQAPARTLNIVRPLTGKDQSSVAASKSSIIYNGAPISPIEASRVLGSSLSSLRKRLRAWRDRGEYIVPLERLIELSAQNSR